MAIKIVDGPYGPEYKRDDFDWHITFMEMAYSISKLSKDPSSKIGSILVSPCRTKMGSGFNGFPKGFPDSVEWWNNRGNDLLFNKYELVDHAERNAIDYCDNNLQGWSIYITDMPCYACAKAIYKAGIINVYYSDKNQITMDLQENKSKFIFNHKNISLTFINKNQLFK